MKLRVMRFGGVEESPDVNDIRQLAREIGISISEEALQLVAEFYPNNVLEPMVRFVLEPKVRFGLEEILGNASDSAPGLHRPEPSQPSASVLVLWLRSPVGPPRANWDSTWRWGNVSTRFMPIQNSGKPQSGNSRNRWTRYAMPILRRSPNISRAAIA
jgi:hypothetical protein